MKTSIHCCTIPPRRLCVTKLLLAVTVTCASLLFGSSTARAESKTPAKNAAASDAKTKQAAIQWLNDYLQGAAILTRKDVAKIREAVSQMSPTQLKQWLDQTRHLRAAVESPEWQATREWLRSFLKVQAIYSDKELEQLRQQVLTGDSDQLLDIMDKIEQKRKTLSWMHRSSASDRKAAIKGNEAYVKNQASAAKAARSRSGSRPLFGSGNTKAGNANTAKYSRRYPGVGAGSYGFLRGGWWGW